MATTSDARKRRTVAADPVEIVARAMRENDRGHWDATPLHVRDEYRRDAAKTVAALRAAGLLTPPMTARCRVLSSATPSISGPTPPHATPGSAFTTTTERTEMNMTDTKTKTARFVKQMTGYNGNAALYELSEPIVSTDWDDKERARFTFVIVSSARVPYSGPETYIFGADSDGEIVDWLELEGSYRGGLDHAKALTGAGYGIAA